MALVIAASGLPTTTVQPLAQILILAALVYPIAGAIRGHMRGAGPITAQVGGLLIFAGIAAAAMMAGREAGILLLIIGYLGHAIWDVYHFIKRKVVWREYAEFCGVLDFIIAVLLAISLING
ncbi:hypothetical protein MJA45_02340 [Paenibacillus aurantius]|uniref:Uncharacterized protein n=1 Tax=Paenibacillus aurantius TaxID=2918900 RepID=A0AA96LDS2_9BACL|nr:hypothetical protein [Paenibacillus aurantius]WNQ11917.1 hypothetical protein MJA45_02340 [Paenibacillus aurantius]